MIRALLPLVALLATPAIARAAEAPIPIRMVVVTAFEIGADIGDKAGEFQAWATAMPATLPFPPGERDLHYDAKRGILVISLGMGTNRAATSTMTLGLDPRFDLRRAYWLVAAIAGVNPNEASVGSAAWIGDLIDTDFGFEIDSREIPADWVTGRVPWERSKPYATPVPADRSSNLFPLDKGLRDWAFALTAKTAIADNATLKTIRARYTTYPKAMTPPVVLTGDEATGQTFWHGKLLNSYAEDWTKYWTGGTGRFVMTGMEDTGVARALGVLGKLGRADPKRLMVLRTGANYTLPAPGQTAAESLHNENSELSALQSSLDAAYLVGGKVVDEITGNWPRYADTIPGSQK